MSDTEHNKEAAPPGWLRRNVPLRAVLIILLMAGLFAAAWRWQQSRSIGAQVEAVGGSFRVDEYQPELSARARLERLLDGQPIYRDCAISFWRCEVNDEWLREHRDQLAALRHLHLVIVDSPVTDRGLRELRDLNDVTALTLSAITVTDAGMEHVATMTGLQTLSLNQTQIGLAGIEQLASLPHLSHLYIGGTQITGDDLVVIQEFSALRSIWIDDSQATAIGIANLQLCPQLKRLSLHNANDGIVSLLSGWEQLTSLTLKGTDVTDASTSDLTTLEGLRYLMLRDTSVSDAGLAQLQQALPDCRIERFETPISPPR